MTERDIDDVLRKIIEIEPRLEDFLRINRSQIVSELLAAQLSDHQADSTGKFTRESETSKESAYAVRPRTGTQRHKILSALYFQVNGLTREQLSEQTGLVPDTVRPRVAELMEGGWIHDSGRRMKTRFGNPAEILELTSLGRAKLDLSS